MASGCSYWDGSSSQTGAAGCPVATFGGHETSINNTFSLSEIGLENFSELRIGYKANQVGGGPVTVDHLVLLIMQNSGALLHSESLASSVYFPSSIPGTGHAAFGFTLDEAGVAASNAFLGVGANRLGLAAQIRDDVGGFESFYFQRFEQVNGDNGNHVIPEPATAVLLGTGLALVALFRRRIRA